jgi:hypothetical protein
MLHPRPKSYRRLALLFSIPFLLAMVWPWSYFLADSSVIDIGTHRVTLSTGPGWMAFTFGSSYLRPTRFHLRNHPMILDSDARQQLANPQIYSGPNEYHFYYPLWLLTVASVLWALGLVVSHARQMANYNPGCCDVCGYDLRASPGRCPEFGTVRA